jgi:hypothetical protein
VTSPPLQLARSDARFLNLDHGAYLEALEGSRVLVSSPGLHATQEALARRIPCLLLPSQNLSQALALRKLDQAGASFAVDWDTIYGLTGLSASDEGRSCQRIADCIYRFERDAAARGRLIRHISDRLAPDRLGRIASAQAAFLEPFRDKQGPQKVAAYVRHLVSPRGM